MRQMKPRGGVGVGRSRWHSKRSRAGVKAGSLDLSAPPTPAFVVPQ